MGDGTGKHLLLLTGIGGHPPSEALDSLATVTSCISVLHITAWTGPEEVEAAWLGRRHLSGRFVTARDFAESTEVAVALDKTLAIDGVVTFSELLLKPQADIVQRLELPGNSTHAVGIAQSKTLQRELFAKHDVPSPRFAVVAGAADVIPAGVKVGFPAVFKPSLGAGSVGVQLVSDFDDLRRSFDRAVADETPFIQARRSFLLEERLPLDADGESPYAAYCSVESLLAQGVAHHLVVTDRLRLHHGYAEEGLVVPSRLTDEEQSKVIGCADRAIKAIGLTCGAVHTEVALTDDGPKLIEVNARAGGPVPDLLHTAADYDYAAQIGRAALGLPPSETFHLRRAAWHRFIPIPDGEWRIREQTDAAEVLKTFSQLIYLSPRFRVGQVVSRARTLHLASFMVGADSLKDARSLAEQVERALNIRLDSVRPPTAS